MSQNKPDFNDLLRSARRSAVHLEMRDSYGVGDEQADFDHWKATGERDTDPTSEYWAPWVNLIQETVGRGVRVRRARIVSEPVTDYIRYEHAATSVNLFAGEEVRWLSRRNTLGIGLPGNDLWLFDEQTVLFNHFTGDGTWADPKWEVVTEPAVVLLAARSFEKVWARGTDHDQYKV